MHLEADLTDAIVSADAASVINNDYFSSSLGERGSRPCGPAPPPGKEPGMTEVRDAVMRRWLTSDILELGDHAFASPRAWGCDIIPCQSHLFISCIMRPVFDVVFEAHDFPLTLIGNKKSAKQLLPDFEELIPFDAPNHDDSNDLFNDLVKMED